MGLNDPANAAGAGRENSAREHESRDTVYDCRPFQEERGAAMRRRSVLSVLLVTALLSATLFGVPVQAATRGRAEPKVDLWLTVLHNSDGESQLIDLGGGLEDFGGVARFKTLADDLKWEATHAVRPYDQLGAKRGVLMVSSGDNFLAGPEFNVSLDKGAPFYDTIAMDWIGYDAIGIGNHDFDFGPDVLADFIGGFSRTKPTYLSANLGFSAEPALQAFVDSGRLAKSTVIKERGELIGIVGATTPALAYISSPRDVEIMDDVAAAVQAEVDMLESKRINKIVLISHLQSVEEDLDLIGDLDGVDVVVAGGGDEMLANEGDLLIPGDESIVYGPYPMIGTDIDGTSVPIVTTPGGYAYIGKLTVAFDKAGNVIATGNDSGPVRVAGGDNPDAVRPDPIVQRLVVDPVIEALADMAANVLANSEVALDGVKSHVRTFETNEGDLVADSLLWKSTQLASAYGMPTPDIAIQNGGSIRNDSVIPAGPITELDTFSMLPFPNFVCIVPNIPRTQFLEILENAVSRVEYTDGRFAQIAGFKFTYDMALPAGSRVVSAELDDGTPLITAGVVVPGADLHIATLDFLAKGGDQYPFAAAPFTTLGTTYQQALEDYLVDGLSGTVTSADYPEGGEGRITRLN